MEYEKGYVYKLMDHTRMSTKCFALKLTSFVLCVTMLLGFPGISVLSEAAENDVRADNPHRLVDLYCSQTAKDALGYEKLQELVDLIVESIEPQAVNLLIERFPCFRDAAAKDEIGREIGLYIYYGEGDLLCRMYAHWDHLYDSRAQRYDLETASEDNDDGHVNGAVYVSGYMACLYLADLECRKLKGSGAVTLDQNGEVESISSENLREGLSAILSRLHQGDTLDEVINDVSGGAFKDTEDFTRRFIKGIYNEEKRDYDGEPDSLSFCVGFLNYMSRMDALDPETHPAGSMLFDDFASTQPTPLERDKAAESDFFRFVGKNTLVVSTVPDEREKDGGTTYSGRDML